MEIKSIKSSNGTTRMTAINSVIDSTNRLADSSLTQFVDGLTPVMMNYYSYDKLASVVSIGEKTNLGPYSGATKYKFIKNYIAYGYPEEKNTTIERDDKTDIQLNVDNNLILHLPNTIMPKPGDRFTLQLENHRVWYKITSVNQTTLHNRPFISADYTLDKELPEELWAFEDMKREGLISQELLFVQENVGTDYTPFMKSSTYDSANIFNELYNESLELFNDLFYDEQSNMVTALECDTITRAYSPIIVDLQMEFFPLKIYGNDMILSHESKVDRLNKFKYRNHYIRKTIIGKNTVEGEKGFYKYGYVSNMNDPFYQIHTYMNSTKGYKVYDYSDTPNTRKERVEINYENEIYKPFFDKWRNNELNDLSVLNDFLENNLLSRIPEINFEEMLFYMTSLIILKLSYENIFKESKLDRFY